MLTETLPAVMYLSAGPMVAWWAVHSTRRVTVVFVAALSILANYVGARYYPCLGYPGFQQERAAAWSIRENELTAGLEALVMRLRHRLPRARVPVERERS